MATCPFCCLHCDDLRVEFRGGHLACLSPACKKAEVGYHKYQANEDLCSQELINKAVSLIQEGGKALLVLSEAVDQETGWSTVQFARAISARLVRGGGESNSEISVGLRRAGMLQVTLGELQRDDAPIFIWGPDPVDITPRIWEFLGIDKQRFFVDIPSMDGIHLVRWLRLAHRGETPGIPQDVLPISEAINRTEKGTFLISQEWITQKHSLAPELLLYLSELNQKGRWYGLIYSTEVNSLGINDILLSESLPTVCQQYENGFPVALPELKQVEQLTSGIGVILFIGPIPLAWEANPSAWNNKPAIVLSPCPPSITGTEWIPMAQPGIEGTGSMVRMDGVPVELTPLVRSSRLNATQVLDRLYQEVKR